MLKTVSLDLGSLRVTEESSKDLKTGAVVDSIWQESRIRKAVPPPMILLVVGEVVGLGKLIREKPAGIESKSSAEVVLEVIQVSVIANKSI